MSADALGPRNFLASERGQALRAEIRKHLERHPPTAPPLTAKRIHPLLSRKVSVRTIQWHLHAIRSEHGKVALGAIQHGNHLNHPASHGDAHDDS